MTELLKSSFLTLGPQGAERIAGRRAGLLLPGALAMLLLAGCGGRRADPQDSGPVVWWHGLEGGPIAAERPAPPGADAPYPNLSTVPGKPAPIDPAGRTVTSGALETARANATYEARQDPLSTAPARAANGLFAPAVPLPAASADAAGAALEAATPKPAAGAPEPQKPDSAAAAKPAGPVVAAGGASSPADVPIPDIVPDTTPAPAIPDAPPPLPVLAGVQIPVTRPSLTPVAPPPPPAVPGALSAGDAAPVSFAFAPGSAILSSREQGAIRTLAFRRGSHAIEIVGFGESDGQDPQSQYAGVQLGLARAHAIAAALEGWTVPMTAMRIGADAPGRGAAARLVD